ncbi:MAG: fatty acid desaturase [Cyanobacteria bacterium J06648_16]
MTATLDRPIQRPQPSPQPLIDLREWQLKDVIKTLPRECFEKNRWKAWRSVLLTIVAVVTGYAAIWFSPWFLLPIAWFFTGTALTGCFVIGHDCGHRSFAKRRWVNDLVGHIMLTPLIYPFHCWRLLHDVHHLHTNKMDVDNAWHPWYPQDFEATNGIMKGAYRAMRQQLWWLASIIHWAGIHFDVSNFKPCDRKKARFSMSVVIAFAAICFPTLIAVGGLWGFVKFWLMPWLGYHFWMSTFTLVHHTAPDIQFHPAEQWNAVEAQLAGTVHCNYPKWIERLCHDINVHVPHHISTGIPSYNLRRAHRSLKATFGAHVREETFSLSMMNNIIRDCHLYHPEEAYLPFRKLKRQRTAG